MHARPRRRAARSADVLALAAVLLASLAGEGFAAPELGFRESFPAPGLGNWLGGSTYDNPGTGGVGGVGDGYLRVSVAGTAGHLGAASEGSPYVGNWQTAGITMVRLWLKDVDAPQPLEIHFSLGYNISAASRNFWQYNTAFIPPADRWGSFSVPITGPTNWTRIIGASGTFQNAIQNVDRVHVRYDLAPFQQQPDFIEGDFGLDELVLTDGLVGVEDFASGVGSPVMLGAPSPNPSRGRVAFFLQSAGAHPVRIQVVDVAGRIVRRAELPAQGAPERVWMWDGRDDRGAPVPSGRYRARAWDESGGTSRPFVIVR